MMLGGSCQGKNFFAPCFSSLPPQRRKTTANPSSPLKNTDVKLVGAVLSTLLKD